MAKNPLSDLIQKASKENLSDLIIKLCKSNKTIETKCIEYLMEQVEDTENLKAIAQAKIMMNIWNNLKRKLQKLDKYGGGHYRDEEWVNDQLYGIITILESEIIERKDRIKMLDLIRPFLRSGNAGMDDSLIEVAFATCYSKEDYLYLIDYLTGVYGDDNTRMIRSIYLRIGEPEKYLELRLKKMDRCWDYMEVVQFLEERGDTEQALEIAREGIDKAEGNIDKLQSYVAEKAMESGDRETYLTLQFERVSNYLTLKSYTRFEAICTTEEWKRYEPSLLDLLTKAYNGTQMEIYLYRKEYEKTLNILLSEKVKFTIYIDSDFELQIAKKLETHYPKEICNLYLTVLGPLDSSCKRDEYNKQAVIIERIRNIMIELLHDEECWKKYAREFKQRNKRRPAFHEECAIIMPDWRSI